MLEGLAEAIKSLPEAEEHEGLKEEVAALVSTFLTQKIEEIRNPEAITSKESQPKEAERAQIQKEAAPILNKEELRTFLNKYGKFGFKAVTAKAVEDGAEVRGVVVKNDFPYLIVDDKNSGKLVRVDPETVKLG